MGAVLHVAKCVCVRRAPKLSRGQKYAEAKIVKLERGQTTRLEIKNQEIYDPAAQLIAEYLSRETCTCTSLVLESNGFSGGAFRTIAPCVGKSPKLESFTYTLNSIGDAVGGKKNVIEPGKTLLLSAFHGDAAACLGFLLKTSTTLTYLKLDGNALGSSGCIALAEALEDNEHLRELSLVRNLIDDAGCFAIAQALRKNVTCTSLDLDENVVGDETFVTLLEALSFKGTMQRLNLRANCITSSIPARVAEALGSNRSLVELNLRRNCLQDIGCALVAKGLSHNTALKCLHLSSNRINNDGCIRLAEALEANNVLEELYLDINGIEDEGCCRFAKALESKNDSLHKVDMRMNSFEKEGFEALVTAVAKNSTLETFELSLSTPVGKVAAEKINEKLAKNTASSRT